MRAGHGFEGSVSVALVPVLEADRNAWEPVEDPRLAAAKTWSALTCEPR